MFNGRLWQGVRIMNNMKIINNVFYKNVTEKSEYRPNWNGMSASLTREVLS